MSPFVNVDDHNKRRREIFTDVILVADNECVKCHRWFRGFHFAPVEGEYLDPGKEEVWAYGTPGNEYGRAETCPACKKLI